MFKGQDIEDRTTSLDVLQNFQINTNDDWTHWNFNHDQIKDIPLSFTNKYNFYKNIKFCDLSSLSHKYEEADYMVIEAIAKKKNKQFISKNAKVTEKRIQGNPTTKQYTKKAQKFWRPWVNQNKTNFKKITVKNDWKQIKNINKGILEGLPKNSKCQVEELKTIGKVRKVDQKLSRVSWVPIRFKQNQSYQLQSVATEKDDILTQICSYVNQQQNENKFNVICAPEFLLTLLTVRGSVYPWNIEVQKEGNIIILQNYKSADDDKKQLTYIDLFNTNENTTNHMPLDENKVRQTCINATKLTKVFQDMLASDDFADVEYGPESQIFKIQQDEQDDQEEDEDEEEEEEEEKENLEKLRKYLKLGVGDFDIYTYSDIDGVKENGEDFENLLIRVFMESETQGAWINQMKTSPGSIITREYHANNCSIQKWICEAKLLGVQKIKFGYMGYQQNRPVLLNVHEATIQGLQKTLSFRMQECWGFINYVLKLISDQQDGKYVLAKAPYTPLSIKLYLIQPKVEEEQQQDQQDEQN